MPPAADPARAEMLVNRVRKNRRRLAKRFAAEDTTAYRLYDMDIPEIPLLVDWYDGAIHVAEVTRERGAASAGDTLELARALAQALDVPDDELFLKRRQRQAGKRQYRRQGDEDAQRVVRDAGVPVLVNLSDYIDTGLFLDHRPLRRRVGREADGRRVLNLFCYTGAFTAHAAAGGAWETLSVDMSRTYLDWAAETLRLGGHTLGDGEDHRLARADVVAELAAERSEVLDRHAPFDLAIVDPPTFSNSKRMDGTFDVQRDHVPMLRGVLRRMAPGGVVYFSTNRRRFKLDAPALGCGVEDLAASTVPPDFRGRPHRAWRLTVTP